MLDNYEKPEWQKKWERRKRSIYLSDNEIKMLEDVQFKVMEKTNKIPSLSHVVRHLLSGADMVVMVDRLVEQVNAGGDNHASK